MDWDLIISAIGTVLFFILLPLALTIYFSEPLIIAVFALFIALFQFGLEK